MLRALLDRDPAHLHAQYLLAAQHAQLGLVDRAEAGFRTVTAQAPEFPMPRFQLAQLLLMRGGNNEARELLAPVAAQPDALGAYARGLAVADDDIAGAVRELEAGLALPQDVPNWQPTCSACASSWQKRFRTGLMWLVPPRRCF
jgi:predicted Zn-dependent protease